MERQLLERMIGAGILLIVLVVVVPAILGGRPEVDQSPSPDRLTPDETAPGAPLRTHTFRLDGPSDHPPVARQHDEPTVQITATSDPSPDTAPSSVSESSPEPPQAKAEPVPEPAVQRKTQPRVESKPASKPIPSDTARAGWAVQLGSFSSQSNARRLADAASAAGFPTYLVPLLQGGKTLYRVRVGPRETRDGAVALADGLGTAGFDGKVMEQRPAP